MGWLPRTGASVLWEVSGCGLERGCGVCIRLFSEGDQPWSHHGEGCDLEQILTRTLGALCTTRLPGEAVGEPGDREMPLFSREMGLLLPVWGPAHPPGGGVTWGLEWVCLPPPAMKGLGGPSWKLPGCGAGLSGSWVPEQPGSV